MIINLRILNNLLVIIRIIENNFLKSNLFFSKVLNGKFFELYNCGLLLLLIYILVLIEVFIIGRENECYNLEMI